MTVKTEMAVAIVVDSFGLIRTTLVALVVPSTTVTTK